MREEGVRRPYVETDDQELEELLHGVVRPDRGREPGPAPALTSLGQQGSGGPNGEPHSTSSKLNTAVSTQLPSRPPGEIGRATSELQSLMRISYAVFCLKKKTRTTLT